MRYPCMVSLRKIAVAILRLRVLLRRIDSSQGGVLKREAGRGGDSLAG